MPDLVVAHITSLAELQVYTRGIDPYVGPATIVLVATHKGLEKHRSCMQLSASEDWCDRPKDESVIYLVVTRRTRHTLSAV